MNAMIRYTTTQNDLLIGSLMEYYKDPKILKLFASIINGEFVISLRMFDWFPTNYSKKEHIVYNLKTGKRFRVFPEYRLCLKGYSKKRFDPFCRWERITIPFDDNTCIETTIGQLNFFRWIFENEVIEYILEHYDEIEADMNQRSGSRRKAAKTPSGGKTRKRREELSVSACKCIKKEDVVIKVSFD